MLSVCSTTHRDFYAAQTWLLQMAAGAEKNDIYIKYCMSLPREILTSVMTTNVKFSPPFFILKKKEIFC